ncbi:MAG TPA: DNA helicase RecQ [Bacteriovoracaceae bacterium]|nr:DNA helicase RecQ [Bacteriovoracaceae bacterium]
MREQRLLELLKETFGYTTFRFEQQKIINSVLDGKDTLAIMPTGGGKSLCYQVPALFLEGATLVISPLISLMQDQVMNLREYGVESVFLNSSQSYAETRQAKEKIKSGQAKLVYVSPEGILSDHLGEFFKDVKVSLIAIDEAHCVSQWGHEFRKDYTRLGELKDKFPGVPVIALTATADAKTRLDIAEQLRMQQPQVFISSFDRPNIKYMILERSEELKQLSAFISSNHPSSTGIVYCLSRDKVERVAEALRKLGFPAVPYHAGLSQSERSKNQALFNTEDRIIVVATIAFGMGIDRPDVRFVAHLDLPKSIESYYQETGRAGRDGKLSEAWMIYGLQDVVKLSQMLETTDADESYKKVARHKLDCMLALCEAATCRRKYLLRYFGQLEEVKCGHCDTCLEPPVMWDATVDAQKILSTIYRTQQVFGAGHVIDVIRGSKNAKITQRKHDALSVYGIGKDKPKEHWNSILRQLLNLGYISIKNWEYRSLGLNQKTQEILTGGSTLYLRKQEYSVEKKSKRELVKGKDADHGKNELFDALKALRNKLAKEKKLPSYIIFNDKSLHDMCQVMPRDPKEFLMVHGVGQNKLENYGSDFLALINTFRG